MKQICVILLFLPFFGFSQQQFEVFFDFNAAVPNENSLTKLNQWIKENKLAEITKVLGYCDSVDDSQYNKDLAMRRINSVLALLKKDSINISDNVELKPFGKDFKYSKKQEENRKVTFFYTLKLKEKAVIGSIWFDSHGAYRRGYSSINIGKDEKDIRFNVVGGIHNRRTGANRF